MPAKEDFDSIFDDTKSKKKPASKTKKAAVKKAAAKKKPVKKTAAKAGSNKAPTKKAASQAKGATKKAVVQEPLKIDRFSALKTILKNHESEAMYRKSKEDRILVLSCLLLAAVVFGVMIVLSTNVSIGWFGRMIIRLFFAGTAALVGLSAGAILELNRKRLQDILAMIVKIQESFELFKEGAYPTGNGPYFPNTYKFIGSINDDETNYAQLIIKVAAAGAVVAVLLLG